MRPKWPKIASLAKKICTLWFQFFDACFATKGYPFKNILFVETISFWHLVVPLNNFASMINCPWEQGRSNNSPEVMVVVVWGGGGVKYNNPPSPTYSKRFGA